MLRIVDLKMSMCHWDNYEEICHQQIAQIKAGGDTVDVFNLQALPVDYAFIGRAARQATVEIGKESPQFHGNPALGSYRPARWPHPAPPRGARGHSEQFPGLTRRARVPAIGRTVPSTAVQRPAGGPDRPFHWPAAKGFRIG